MLTLFLQSLLPLSLKLFFEFVVSDLELFLLLISVLDQLGVADHHRLEGSLLHLFERWCIFLVKILNVDQV